MKKRKILPIACVTTGLLWAGLSQAQESVNASAGNASGSGGAVSYSVGQVVYSSNTGSNGSVAQGVQHPYEISVVTGFVYSNDIQLKATVFPNPTTEVLKLELQNVDLENLSFQLVDANGLLLQNGKIVSDQTSIRTNDLVPAIYYVNVIGKDNQKIHSFKIVKN